MGRWSEKETTLLVELRSVLKNELEAVPQYPDVVGDRRLLRFLRGEHHDVNVAAGKIRNFLKWREANNLDEIRRQIVYGGIDSPSKFPLAKILDILPQIVILHKHLDDQGSPITLDHYDFSPKEVLKQITLEQYLEFLIYSMEYRSLILEQMSEERERELMIKHNGNPPILHDSLLNDEGGYGIILRLCCIRDLKGLGLDHVGADGKAIVSAAVKIGLDNYSEFLRKTYMINSPFVFNCLWYFIKGMLDAATIAKIAIFSSSYKDNLLKDIPAANIPDVLDGGKLSGSHNSIPFVFDGDDILHYPGAPEPGATEEHAAVSRRQSSVSVMDVHVPVNTATTTAGDIKNNEPGADEDPVVEVERTQPRRRTVVFENIQNLIENIRKHVARTTSTSVPNSKVKQALRRVNNYSSKHIDSLPTYLSILTEEEEEEEENIEVLLSDIDHLDEDYDDDWHSRNQPFTSRWSLHIRDSLFELMEPCLDPAVHLARTHPLRALILYPGLGFLLWTKMNIVMFQLLLFPLLLYLACCNFI